SKSASSGAKAIFSKLRVVSKMNFPMSILPNYTIFSKFMVHVVMVGIIIVILQFAGYPINIYYLQMPYFMIATYFFTFSFVLIFSTLSTLVRDIYKLLTSTMRIGIYISPILWDVTEVKDDGTVATAVITAIVKLNPLTYLIEGYRASYFGVEWYFITESGTTLYFWTLTLILFVIGSVLHMHFRKYFIDFL
ncbi:MAG TPA: ABC transporter permease, partial [Virgibacillus sp.]|nr:ABC transporter permease [Virgibacillus sp.]